MEYMTAEQAAEAAKGLTFEKVWAAMMESRQKMDESDKQIKESNLRIEESFRRMEKQSPTFPKTSAGSGTPSGVLPRSCFHPNYAINSTNSAIPSTRRLIIKDLIKTAAL